MVKTSKHFYTVATIALLLAVTLGIVSLWRSSAFPWKQNISSLFGRSQSVVFQPSGPILQIPPSVLLRRLLAGDSTEVPRKVSSEDVAKVQQELSRRPQDPETLNDAGCIFAAAGDVNQGVQLLEEAHSLAPDNPNIGYNFARGLYQQGKIDEALKQTDEVLKKKPDLDEARLLRASAAITKKDYRAAEDELSKLVRKIQLAALLIQGVIQLAEGKSKEAVASFEEALKLAAADPVALYNAGVASQRHNDLTQATDYYKRALAQDPSLAEAHNNLGTILMQSGDRQAAFEEFHAAALQKSDHKMESNLRNSLQGFSQSGDDIVGDWSHEGGSWDLSGTFNGEPGSHSIPIPPGRRIKVTKISEGIYQFAEENIDGTATFTFRSSGVYEGAAVETPEATESARSRGVASTGTVSLWLGGETLFGETKGFISGPKTSVRSTKSWKALRVK